MPPKEQPQEVSNSGITTGPDGQRHIAASVRADGSIRKEIKIRPGYRPPEDIETYKNRTAEAFRNRGTSGVPGAEVVDDGKDESKEASASSNKNAKRREARKRAKEKEKDEQGREDGAAVKEVKPEESGKEEKPVDPEAEKEKEAKKLAKKLRQARELKERNEKGDALLPEQLQKVIRINELIRQLDTLGFDTNGEKKVAAEVT